MKSKLMKVTLQILVIMLLVGCPNNGPNTSSSVASSAGSSGAGGKSSSSMSSTNSGSTNSGSTSSVVSSSSVSSSSGSTVCEPCSAKLFIPGPHVLCTQNVDGGLSSQQIWDNLQHCTCLGGACSLLCQDNYCVAMKPGTASMACDQCIRAGEGCSKSFDLCVQDN